MQVALAEGLQDTRLEQPETSTRTIQLQEAAHQRPITQVACLEQELNTPGGLLAIPCTTGGRTHTW